MIVDPSTAATWLARDRVVAYPTETVYGLGARAHSARALERLRALKERVPERGLSVLVADVAALARVAPDLPRAARVLAERFWPGPLTLVVPCSDPHLAGVATERGVGFRCSPHPTALALALACDAPIVSTSCNLSGDPPAETADEVERVFGADLPIAGGEPAGGLLPSTVVCVSASGRIEVLREGAVPTSALENPLAGGAAARPACISPLEPGSTRE